MNQPAEIFLKTVGFLRFHKTLRDDLRSLFVTRSTRDRIHSGADSFQRGAIVAVGELPEQRWSLRRNFAGANQPNRVREFPATGKFGGKLRVPVGLARAGHDKRANCSGGTRPFEANLTASLP